MKKIKKILKYILIIILVMISIDITLVTIFKLRPIFSYPINIYRDGGSTEYYGLGYKVIKCKTLNGDNSIHLGFYNIDIEICN